MNSGSAAELIDALATPSAKKLGASLTEFEVQGLSTKFNFADGHAYHGIPWELHPVMNSLLSIWEDSTTKSVPQVEFEFKRALAGLIASPALINHEHFSICPTASNSIDVAGSWLNLQGYRTGLIEPAFDNLFLLLKRRGVQIESIQEDDIADLERLEGLIKSLKLQALVIVSPNNPTGFELSELRFKELCELCARMKVTLVTDRTFRFYSTSPYDDYKYLIESGVKFITIEDTGKTWATQDLKVRSEEHTSELQSQR